jgi:ribosomal 50S subunit-associated protein YjgA (DUF615 family)
MTLQAKLDEMQLHDGTGDPRDEGYMAALEELREWLVVAGEESTAQAMAEYDGYDWSSMRELPRHGDDMAWCKDDYRKRARKALGL